MSNILLSDAELDQMADWLNARADELEATEPHATNTIANLRGAAAYVTAWDPED